MPARSWRDTHIRLLLFALLAGTMVTLIVSGSAAAADLADGDYAWGDVVGSLTLLCALMIGIAAYRTRDLIARLDHQAREATTRFESVAAQSRDWIWQASLEGIITYSSPGVRPLLGYQPTDLIGRSVFEVLAPEDHALGAALLKSAQAGSGWHRTPTAWRHVDGHLVRLVGSAEPIVDSAGNVVGIRGVRSAVEEPHRDITAQRDGIRRVITERRLAIALQPIVDIDAGRWVGAEALARFRPTESVEVVFRRAQEVGLAEELEAAAAESAFALLDSIPPSVYLAINLSPLALLHPAVQQVLDRHRDRFDRIVLELTEHVSVSDYDQVHEMLQPLRRLGLRFAIDDAGAGYASFLHVVRLRPDIIKLDRALVENMGDEPAKRAVARAVCTLASEINASVVAEGVENTEDMASAADVGLVLQQGYVFARPSTDAKDWAAWAARPWPHEQP